MGDIPLITKESVLDRFVDTTALYAGRGKRYSTATIADAAKIVPRTFESYHEWQSLPGLVNFLKLVQIMPDTWTNEILALAGKGHVSDLEPGETCHFDLSGQAGHFIQILSDAMQDGHVDHIEQKKLKRIAAKLRGACDQYINRS